MSFKEFKNLKDLVKATENCAAILNEAKLEKRNVEFINAIQSPPYVWDHPAPFHKVACIFHMGFSGGKNRKNDINSPNLGFMSFYVFSTV